MSGKKVKLSKQEIREIKVMGGVLSSRQLADNYDVSLYMILRVQKEVKMGGEVAILKKVIRELVICAKAHIRSVPNNVTETNRNLVSAINIAEARLKEEIK